MFDFIGERLCSLQNSGGTTTLSSLRAVGVLRTAGGCIVASTRLDLCFGSIRACWQCIDLLRNLVKCTIDTMILELLQLFLDVRKFCLDCDQILEELLAFGAKSDDLEFIRNRDGGVVRNHLVLESVISFD